MNLNIFQWHSVKTRVTIVTLAIFITGIWSLSFYASQMLRQDMQRLLGEQQFSNVSLIATSLNEELDARLGALEQIATDISPNMQGNPAALQRYLEQRQVFYSLFNDGIYITQLDGTAIASLPLSAKRIGVNYLDRDFITAALKDEKAIISRPVMEGMQRAPTVVMATPIRNAQGKVIGALAGVINLESPNFLDKITKGSYGKAGFYLLAAPQHKLFITSSDKNRIMRAFPLAGINPMHDKFAQGYEGYGLLQNFRGEEELAAARKIPIAGWFVAVGLPTTEAFAPIRVMQRNILLATALLTLLAGGLTWWMLRRQLAPMLTAVERLTALSATDLPLQPLPIQKPDEIGQLIGGVNHLIETLARREYALKESEERLRLALDAANIGDWEQDLVTQTSSRSRKHGEIFGQTEPLPPWSPQAFQAHIHPDDRAWVERTMEESMAAGQDWHGEFRIVRDDHAVRWVWAKSHVFKDHQNQPSKIHGMVSDITEQKAQQTQIKLAAQVFAQGREGITISDAQGDIVLVNKAFSILSGYSEAELLGKNMRILSSGRHSQEFYSAMWEAIYTKDHWAGEIWDIRQDGTEFPVWLTISSLRDPQGQITNYLGNFSDLSDAKAAENRIQWLSHFDHLTGLPNRALLQDRTEHAIAMAQRASEPLTMMLVSIDHFKSVTDALGHQVGDKLLMEMAKRLTEAVRAQDTVARTSGKEFVLVLPCTPAEGAAHLATELLLMLAKPYQLDAHELTITASIGIASYPENGSNFNALLKAVEIARHHAKVDGRNTFQFYKDDMYREVLARDQMTKALRHAAALDQLQLLYQPLVDLQTGQISGVEALLRWHHPELGDVSPVQFIPLAEESGLIYGLGEWVLRSACRDIRAWADKGIQVPHVAVNVSPLQFHDPALVDLVKNTLAEWQIDPMQLYLEVTEGALMDDVPRSEAMLMELKKLGVKLSLDDFGTGYSSLSYLKRLPFDKVKIDQSFVHDITTSQSDNVIVKVIVSMAHGLGLKVIAEGVETEAQCEIMRSSVCDEIQGYFFSRPISAQAIEEMLTEGKQLPSHLLRERKLQRTLLLVDDEPNIVAALKRLFRRDGHIILTAYSGLEALEVLASNKVDVIISDQRMPGMTGVEFLRAAKVRYPDTIRIVLSGYTELQSVTDAINEGAVYRFLTKPWDDQQLREHIQKAFEYKELLEENKQLDIKIRTTNQELVAANRQLGDVLQKTRHKIERDETSLAIVREALQHMPLPVIGVDDEGLIAFINTAAEQLFVRNGPLLGVELAFALPTVDTAIASTEEGIPSELEIERTNYHVKWNTMGANSRSRGKLVTLTTTGLNS